MHNVIINQLDTIKKITHSNLRKPEIPRASLFTHMKQTYQKFPEEQTLRSAYKACRVKFSVITVGIDALCNTKHYEQADLRKMH